jgi:prepilin-type N-terminal cleavage/methylation domain-containing protein
MKDLKKRTEGFTIIEVMIVIAIAGLILLIVFLAIPALQRNSRNTQRKNEAGAIVAAVNEYSNNNNGQIPNSQENLDIALQNAKLNFYSGQVDYVSSSSPTWPDVNAVVVNGGYKCDGQTAVAVSNRSSAVLFAVETGNNGTANQCVDG